MALEVEYVNVNELVLHPKNMHTHSDEQIDRLIKLIDYQTFRNPIIVQKGTNHVVAGNGRLMAARKMGMTEIPVIYQEFDSEAQLYAYIVSDNAIGKDTWATLDLGKINTEILSLDLDIELLGIKDFKIDAAEVDFPNLGDGSDPDIQQVTFTLSNEQKDILDEALHKAKNNLDCTDEINENTNGNTLSAILRFYLGC